MDKNIFICYARKDLDIIKAFLYDLNEEAENYPFKVNAIIDKSRRVLGTGDRSKEKLQEHIRQSDGAVIFISNRFVDSDFINDYEIPEILKKKQNNPNYVITPIFIDKPKGVNKEILEFQSPNTEEQEIRKLEPGLRELIYKKYTKEIYEYFMDFYNKEVEKREKELADMDAELASAPAGPPPGGLGGVTFKDIKSAIKKSQTSLRNIGVIALIGIAVNSFLFDETVPVYEPDLAEKVENETIDTINPTENEETITTTTAIVEPWSLCLSNTYELYEKQWADEFITINLEERKEADCNQWHDGEFFHYIKTDFTSLSNVEEVKDEVAMSYGECFDVFKNTLNYSPFESPFVIEILVLSSEADPSLTYHFGCFAIFIEDVDEETKGQWSEVKTSILNYDREYLFDFYQYFIKKQEDLSVGECGIHPFSYIGSGDFEEDLNKITTVSCNEPHSFEVFDKFTYTPDKNKGLKDYQDELSEYCADGADNLYSDFDDYSETMFVYTTNIDKLKKKEEVVVHCIVYKYDTRFYLPVKKYGTIKEDLRKKSYQLTLIDDEKIQSVKILNCPDEPMPGYTEEDEIDFYYWEFDWTNLDLKNNQLIMINFYDAVDVLTIELNLNTFSKLDIELSNWSINIPIAWEFFDN